eukprot:6856334-Alexandrium_andersonii.AAC.1
MQRIGASAKLGNRSPYVHSSQANTRFVETLRSDHLEAAKRKREEVADWQAKQRAWSSRVQPQADARPSVAAPGAATSSSAEAASRVQPARLPKHFDLANAATYLPQVGGCFINERSDGRISAFYPRPGARPSTSAAISRWGVEACIKWCIQWAWQEHDKAGHGPCPWPEIRDFNMKR